MEKQRCKADFESATIEKIIEAERLYVAKAKIYSRLLTDTALAEQMSELAKAREEGTGSWVALLTGKESKTSEVTE